jgi:SCP-2 sterol transfer family
MTDPSEAFFDKLRVVGRIPALARVSGTLRLELANGRHTEKTQITVHRGHVTVGPASGRADCMVAAQRKVWDALVTGEAQPLTAYLRGALAAAGDAGMLVAMRRLFAVAGVPELASGRPRLISPSNADGRAGDSAPPNGGRAKAAATTDAGTTRAAKSRAGKSGAGADEAKSRATTARKTDSAAKATRTAKAATAKASRPAAAKTANASRPAKTAKTGRPAKATRSAAGSRANAAATPAGTAGRAATSSSTSRATKARPTTSTKTTAATSRKGRA